MRKLCYHYQGELCNGECNSQAVQFPNCVVFKGSGFSNGYSFSPNHSKTRPHKILTFLSGFQIVFLQNVSHLSGFQMVGLLDPDYLKSNLFLTIQNPDYKGFQIPTVFRCHLNTKPFANLTGFNHLNPGHLHPHHIQTAIYQIYQFLQSYYLNTQLVWYSNIQKRLTRRPTNKIIIRRYLEIRPAVLTVPYPN